MHLLAAKPGEITDGAGAVDLGQTPGEIVVLSAADSDLSCLAAARAAKPEGFPSLRLANLMHLAHPLSVDLYLDSVVRHARLVVARVLGGRGYWSHGVEQVAAACREAGVPVAFLPGDDQPDAELAGFSTLPAEATHRLWQYLVQGGPDNAGGFLDFAAHLIGRGTDWEEPRPLPRAGLYGSFQPDPDRPVAAVVFYRALYQAGNLKAVDALAAGLRAAGLNPLPIHVASLKDPVAAALLGEVLAAHPPAVILNVTGFAAGMGGADNPLAAPDCPVLQVVFAGTSREAWEAGTHGLSARDIAMNVALPEVDGRVFTRAVAFKGVERRDPLTECDLTAFEPVPDRVDFVCRLAANWVRLRNTPPADRRIALILANYPNRDGRIGNGVGLDTPAAVINVMHSLRISGYTVDTIPENSDDMINHLRAGPTNQGRARRLVRESLSMADYRPVLAALPERAMRKLVKRWGPAEGGPSLMCNLHFALPVARFGNLAVAVQPARGYNVDPTSSYHDPDLPPTHDYLAFYAWLRTTFDAHAVIHVGKHGNLEWLPGKSVALSAGCYPEAALGALPHLYPFIVNDPGEGTQAKRRASAVIVDHLTPPLTRAETYGPLRELERLADEYYEAAQGDPRRVKVLASEILDLMRATGLDEDLGIERDADRDTALARLDAHLCELKEMQIRDGLHVFGQAPEGRLLTDLLVALARVPRGKGEGKDASLHRALAADLGLGFDPLDCPMAEPWTGPRPSLLADLSTDPWRSTGDTLERLELLAAALVEDGTPPGPASAAVLDWIRHHLGPAVESCGAAEMDGLLRGLDGRFVPPGPSGAPTRGRPEVLPTGRNFYSVDTRTVPTPAAWTLGWRSADLLIRRHLQDHGDWPRAMALTAWGTSNMRTGGDDIAQGLALMGARPTWDGASHRVTGFEILPLDILDRPRVDVTLRVSGFFRDAFPSLIDLFDSAARAVASLDEPADKNPLAARAREERARLLAAGLTEDEATRRAGFRVFGSMPGAYGAGLQALIDEKGWRTDADLARAYLAWGGHAYGSGSGGEAAHGLFETRLARVEAVVQNQDNREHDLLDSDDYYQFEGGMTAAVRLASGAQPAVYHADHARPESPRIRTLEEEVARVVRARAANPKWIAGVMRHGYKGAFEMAATVDYLFAFQATAKCVRDHHFDALFQAYLEDEVVRGFLAAHNPAALKEMAARFLEAQDRGLWRPRLNSTRALLEGLAGKA